MDAYSRLDLMNVGSKARGRCCWLFMEANYEWDLNTSVIVVGC